MPANSYSNDSKQPSTIAQALQAAARQGLERLDAQGLLLHTLGRSPHDRAWLLSHDTDPLDTAALAGFQQLCARRLDNEPMAYLTGWQEFFGLTLQVDHRTMMTSIPGVFAAGDIVRGASLVVWGIRDGRDAADRIEHWHEKQSAVAQAAE